MDSRIALVVDDSKTVRAFLSGIISQWNFQAVDAPGGKEALTILEEKKHNFSVALIDWYMPEMNGLELVKAIRAKPEFASLPIIMVTGETDLGHVGLALEAGANEYLMKPFTGEALNEKFQLMGLV